MKTIHPYLDSPEEGRKGNTHFGNCFLPLLKKQGDV
jgi:hypothetical protein